MDLMVLAMARKYMDKKVAELVSAGWTKEIVKELPTTGNEKTIYMVEQVDNVGNIYYDEYMYTNGKFDGIGTTRVDLNGYARKLYGTGHIEIHESKDVYGDGQLWDVVTLTEDAYGLLSDCGDLLYTAEIKSQIDTELDSTLIPNTDYYLGDVSTDTVLAFPSTAEIGDTIYVNFNCTTAFALTIDTTYTSDIDIDIEEGVSYEIFATFNGAIWILGYNEYTVS